MAKTIKITSSNEISVVDVDFDDYRAIQKVVGGMFETVKTQRMFDYFGKPVMMLVDEEGILKQLPLNRTGSRFYGYPIVGDFILAVPVHEDIVAPDAEELAEWKERLIRDQNLKEVEHEPPKEWNEPCSRTFKCQSFYWLWKTETDIC